MVEVKSRALLGAVARTVLRQTWRRIDPADRVGLLRQVVHHLPFRAR
jgi:hypothetical protein